MRFLLALTFIHVATSFVTPPSAFKASDSRNIIAFSLQARASTDDLITWYQLVDAKSGAFDSDIFAVPMSPHSLTFQLCNAIVAQEKNKLAKVDPPALQVFATRGDLNLNIPLAMSYRLSDLTAKTTEENPLYVVVPYLESTLVSFLRESPLINVGTERRARWSNLNKILAKHKPRMTSEGITPRDCAVTWAELAPVYESITEEYKLKAVKISDDTLYGLFHDMFSARNTLGRISNTSGERKDTLRRHAVTSILVQVCDGFDGDVKIVVDAAFDGNRIHVNGIKSEFYLQRRKKCICIVLPKRDDIDQGIAQVLLGFEALADTKGLDCVYGIVTNYFQWVFVKSLDNRIEKHGTSLEEGSKNSLEKICGLINAMLSD